MAGGHSEHRAKALVRYSTADDGSGPTVIEHWSWTAHPLVMVLSCLLEPILVMAVLIADTATSRWIMAVIAVVPIAYTVTAATRMRAVLAQRALHGADAASPTFVTAESGAVGLTGHESDVSSGAWLTWDGIVTGALMTALTAGFFSLFTTIYLVESWAAGTTLASAVVMFEVFVTSLAVASVGFLVAGNHAVSSVGTTTVAAPGMRAAWSVLSLLSYIARLIGGLLGIIGAIALLTDVASGKGLRGAALVDALLPAAIFVVSFATRKELARRVAVYEKPAG